MAGSWSTWSTCRSSARSLRWSSASWPTGTSPSAASATRSRSPTPPLSTRPSPSPSPPASSAACSPSGASSSSPSSTPARSTAPADGWSATTAGRSPSTSPWSSPSTAAPPTSAARPGLGDELDFVPTDEHTLQAKAAPNIFVIGDAANVPASKAGSVTHFEGETLVGNVRRFLAGEPLEAGFDGHANCFIETGFHKALLIDFNYDTEPLPGHYPATVGLPLLKESRLNHLGKLLFQSVYWHSLLPGRDLPGLGSSMPTAGKHPPVPQED